MCNPWNRSGYNYLILRLLAISREIEQVGRLPTRTKYGHVDANHAGQKCEWREALVCMSHRCLYCRKACISGSQGLDDGRRCGWAGFFLSIHHIIMTTAFYPSSNSIIMMNEPKEQRYNLRPRPEPITQSSSRMPRATIDPPNLNQQQLPPINIMQWLLMLIVL